MCADGSGGGLNADESACFGQDSYVCTAQDTFGETICTPVCSECNAGTGICEVTVSTDNKLCDAGTGSGTGSCQSGTCVEMVLIPAGTFTMGSPTGEDCRASDETEHNVQLTRGFYLRPTEVTQGEFLAEMGYNPSHFDSCGLDCPVETVSWHEGLYFCNQLSIREGFPECFDCSGSLPEVTCDLKVAYATIYDCPGYRLPTEAEWEYAARAGTTTAYYSGDNTSDCGCGADTNLAAIGWYCDNAGGTTLPVGQKDENSLGLYDMSGNVWEWCWDWYASYPSDPDPVVDPFGPSTPGLSRVKRGGSWNWDAQGCRSANRDNIPPDIRGRIDGLRPARSIL